MISTKHHKQMPPAVGFEALFNLKKGHNEGQGQALVSQLQPLVRVTTLYEKEPICLQPEHTLLFS